MFVSVIIPIYKHPSNVDNILEKLLGDILLFLDSDVELPENFIERLVKKMEGMDAVDVRKEAEISGFLSKLINVDYMSMFLTNLISIRFNAFLVLNGACFAVKRDFFERVGGFRRVLTEDVDFGLRASMKGGMLDIINPGVVTKVPSSIKEWYIQRKRWAIGSAQAYLDNMHLVLRNPRMWIPALFLYFPSLIYILLLMVSDSLIRKIVLAVIVLVALRVPLPVSMVLFSSISVIIPLMEKLMAVLITFLVWTSVMVILSRKTGWRKTGLVDLLVYYFVYSPVRLAIYSVSFIKVLLSRRKSIEVEGWKV